MWTFVLSQVSPPFESEVKARGTDDALTQLYCDGIDEVWAMPCVSLRCACEASGAVSRVKTEDSPSTIGLCTHRSVWPRTFDYDLISMQDLAYAFGIQQTYVLTVYSTSVEKT